MDIETIAIAERHSWHCCKMEWFGYNYFPMETIEKKPDAQKTESSRRPADGHRPVQLLDPGMEVSFSQSSRNKPGKHEPTRTKEYYQTHAYNLGSKPFRMKIHFFEYGRSLPPCFWQ